MRRVILDLCAGSGAWSAPYADAGYDVRRVDLPTDVRLMKPLGYAVHGILAAPPCTYFCRMRMFNPWQYGDPWTKLTWVWGRFTVPAEVALAPRASEAWIHRKRGSRGIARTDGENPITPPGFARAFFEANP